MSYEIDNKKEIKCPCGKGTIQLIEKSNEWNQFKEDIIINCNNCKNIYKIERKEISIKPKHEIKKYYCKNITNGSMFEIDL